MNHRLGVRMFCLFAVLILSLLSASAWAQGKEPSGKPLPTDSKAQRQPTGKALPAEGEKPSGNVTMEFGQGGFILSASGGRGTLIFHGRKHSFKVGSLGVGGFGVSRITSLGEVYNLKRLEDFPGTYFQARAGYTALDEGKGVQWMENTNGVVLKLRSTSKGLALHLGADGFIIEMGEPKQAARKK
ncbi:MAG: hypothetical protein ACOZEN_14770 [Thermodesulfobacteriota bacterium]